MSEKFENSLVFMFSGMERSSELSSSFNVDFRLALLGQFRSPEGKNLDDGHKHHIHIYVYGHH